MENFHNSELKKLLTSLGTIKVVLLLPKSFEDLDLDNFDDDGNSY